MATVKQANRRLAEALGAEKHFRHAITERFRQFLLREAGYDLYDMPICPKCEKLAWWDKEGAAFCPHCGTVTKAPITFGEFYEMGYNVDRTVHPGAPVVVDREVARPDEVATIYGGEADLDDKDRVIKVIQTPKKE